MDYEAVDGFLLQHFGIKGMKWGVRRFQNEDGTRTPAGKKRYAKMEKKRMKDPKKMTDEELKTKTQRQRLENDYIRTRKESTELKRQLYKVEHPYQAAAANAVNKVVIGSGTVAASALITQYAKDGFTEILNKIGNLRIR